MSTLEKVRELFGRLKVSPAAEIHNYLPELLVEFPNLPKKDKHDTAHDFFQWAEKNKNSDPLKYAYARYMVALSAFFNEEYREAISLSMEAQKSFLELHDPDGAACCSTVLGGSFRTLGSYDLALKELWEAFEQLKKSGFLWHSILAAGFQIASIYVELKEYEEALPLLNYVYESAQQQNNYVWRINSLQVLGRIYLIQKKFTDAKETLDKSLAEARELSNPMFIAISLTELGNYFFDTGNYSEAERRHRQSLELREKNNFTGGAITNCIQLAEIYLHESREKDAVEILEKGLIMADQIKVKPKIVQLHLLLSKIYRKKNDWEKSLYHYSIYHELHEEVQREDNASKVKNLKLVFEAEQTKKENVIIKAQKLQIEKTNIELQKTIDELTLSKINRKAKTITTIFAIVLLIIEDFIVRFVVDPRTHHNILISIAANVTILFGIKPLEAIVEHFLLKRFVKINKKYEVAVQVQP